MREISFKYFRDRLCEKVKRLVTDAVLQMDARVANSLDDSGSNRVAFPIIIEPKPTPMNDLLPSIINENQKRKSLFSYCQAKLQPTKKKRSLLTEEIDEEISTFLKDNRMDTRLLFEKCHQYPHLHRLGMRVMCVPATSASVERVFSQSGILMRPHRSRLSKAMVSKMTLIKCNLDLLK